MKIKLTEGKLRQIIGESVKRILNEKGGILYNFNPRFEYSPHKEDYDDYYNALRERKKRVKERSKHSMDDIEGQTIIPTNYFLGNKKMTEVVIPEGVTEIQDSAFAHCRNLTNVVLPNTLEVIGHCAFQGCVSLTNIVIPESVKFIGSCAFSDSGLTSIPETQATLGKNVFKGCNIKKTNETLSENKIKNIVSESVKNILNEISSDLLDKATDAAQDKGRVKQMNTFKDGANEKRKKELNPNDENGIISMYINPKRDVCVVQDGNRRLSVFANGMLKSVEDHTFSSNPDLNIISWPLDYKNKLSSKMSKQLAKIIVKWCNKYLSPEGKEKLQGYEDYHNWIQL